MHHSPQTATIVYTMRLRSAAGPPQIQATRSNWNSPMSPQSVSYTHLRQLCQNGNSLGSRKRNYWSYVKI